MKNLSILSVSLLLVIVASFAACEKQEVREKSNEITLLKNAGIEHNEGLDFILSNLKSSKASGQLNLKSSENVFSIIKNNTLDYLSFNSKLVTSDNKEFALKLAEQEFDKVTSSLKSSGTNTLWDSSIESSLTEKQKELLNILQQAIDNENLDLNQTLEVFNAVRNRVMIECTEEEQLAVIAAIEVGTNSLQYWYDNIDEWVLVFSDNNFKRRKWFNWKSVGKSDIKGAVTGAIGALFSGGGVVVGALSGGLGASAADAAGQIYDHLTDNND